MRILQEAKHTVTKLMFKPFGIYYLPKDEIVQMTGGKHALRHEDAMYLFKEVGLFPNHTRDVTVFPPCKMNQLVTPRQGRQFIEIVDPVMAGQQVTVYTK